MRRTIFGELLFASVVMGSLGQPVPAAAQGGASCLFECDAKCYGTSGPYCKSQCMAACNSRDSNNRSDEPQSYGSVYVTNDGSGDYGISDGYADQYSAMAEAERECKKEANGPCYRLLVFANRCAAVIYAKRGDDILDISGSAEPRQADADARGLALCRRTNPGATCEIVERSCD